VQALQNLEVWKRSSHLCVQLYKALENCREWGFRDQITRSALSIPSNIAEGYERDSKRETVRFLRIAKGSCGELWTQLHVGTEAGFIKQSLGKEFSAEVVALAKMLQGLIRHYEEHENSS
jgi:four helix bundle protein